MVCRLFPWLTDWLSSRPDRREPSLRIYLPETLLWAGILMYVCRLRARRQIHCRLRTVQAIAHLAALSGHKLSAMPHGDTVKRYVARLDPSDLESGPAEMVDALVQARRLERFRLLDEYYLVAADMTGHLYLGDRPGPFTEGYLTQTAQDGRTLYYRPVCAAKLVTATGLALSVGTEFVENPRRAGQSEEDYKQDCETKAMPRLLRRVKKAFPRLPVCLLLDSLHCNEPTFALCDRFQWQFLITLKAGSLPTVMVEYHALRGLIPKNRLRRVRNGIVQEYRWVNGIRYGRRRLNVLECRETNAQGECTTWVWATSFLIAGHNVEALAQGARQRWRIENEGFRTQKHAGFAMKHAYALDPTTAKNFYFLLQIAHILCQLFECYNKGKRVVKHVFGSLQNLASALLESVRRDELPQAAVFQAFLDEPIQIRLDTS